MVSATVHRKGWPVKVPGPNASVLRRVIEQWCAPLHPVFAFGMTPTLRRGQGLALALLLSFSAADVLGAQSLLGMTWDGVSGRPVGGVTILVRGVEGEVVGHPGTVSGPDGLFQLDLAPVTGPVILIAEKAGYASSGPFFVEATRDSGGSIPEILLELQDLAASRETFTLLETGSISSQTARVLGWVRERGSGRPISTAEVTVVQTNQTTTTDANGMFVLDRLPPGEVALAVEHLSFAPEGHVFRTEPGRAYEIQATMAADAIPLEGIQVSVRSQTWFSQMEGLRVRMQTGLRGDFVTASEIEARGYPPVEETIRQLPGVRILKASAFDYDIRFRDCEQQPVVFVDGIQTNQPEDGEPLRILKMVHSMDILAVEVYRGAASVPAEFAGPDAMCGALVIWTKRSG